jgi:hypothetical protein
VAAKRRDVPLAEGAVPEGDVTPAPKEIGARHAAARIFAVETVEAPLILERITYTPAPILKDLSCNPL